MAGSSFGTLFRITTWGESHGAGVGVVIDGCPAGLPLSTEDIQKWLDRRKPGQSRFTTARKESDAVEILSGIFEGRTTGTPISLMVKTVISSPPITVRSPLITVPVTRTRPLTGNTVSAITGAGDVPREEKPSDGWRRVP